jgi:hypothetical protein
VGQENCNVGLGKTSKKSSFFAEDMNRILIIKYFLHFYFLQIQKREGSENRMGSITLSLLLDNLGHLS